MQARPSASHPTMPGALPGGELNHRHKLLPHVQPPALSQSGGVGGASPSSSQPWLSQEPVTARSAAPLQLNWLQVTLGTAPRL